jgi:hypothetical protein
VPRIEVDLKVNRFCDPDPSSIIVQPSSFIVHRSSFILHPSSFIPLRAAHEKAGQGFACPAEVDHDWFATL